MRPIMDKLRAYIAAGGKSVGRIDVRHLLDEAAGVDVSRIEAELSAGAKQIDAELVTAVLDAMDEPASFNDPAPAKPQAVTTTPAKKRGRPRKEAPSASDGPKVEPDADTEIE